MDTLSYREAAHSDKERQMKVFRPIKANTTRQIAQALSEGSADDILYLAEFGDETCELACRAASRMQSAVRIMTHEQPLIERTGKKTSDLQPGQWTEV
jgi:hypothetical protein